MKNNRHIWVPIVIGIYFIFMAVYFGRDLIASGQYLRFGITAGVEILLLVALFFALRRRRKYRIDREKSLEDKSRDNE